MNTGQGFLLDRGGFTAIDAPGGSRLVPYGINNHGQIVGAYVDGSNTPHGLLLDNGVFSNIDVPSAIRTGAKDEATVPPSAPSPAKGGRTRRPDTYSCKRRERGSSPTNLFREPEFGTGPTVLLMAHTCQDVCIVSIQKGGHMASVNRTRV